MKQGLAEKEAERLVFEYNMYRRWGKALDALEMLILLSFECGDAFNSFFREKAVSENDLVFEVLTRIHARACQVAYEIFTLLKAGYADGAHARWRCLHELTVIGVFIAESGQETRRLRGQVSKYQIMCESLGDVGHFCKLALHNISKNIMPRSARIDMPGELYHVIVRGIERRDIFLDDEDRLSFVQRLSSLLERTGTSCLA